MEDFTRQAFNKLISGDLDLWQLALFSHEELFVTLYDRLPKVLLFNREPILSHCCAHRSAGTWRQHTHDVTCIHSPTMTTHLGPLTGDHLLTCTPVTNASSD